MFLSVFMKQMLLSLVIFVVTSSTFSNGIVLNRQQLVAWIGPTLQSEVQLFLDHKQISVITTDAFSGLDNVKYLALDFNSLTLVDPLVFGSLRNLERLSLASNQLSHLDTVAAFATMPNLRILNLSWNQLTSIDRNSFVGLVNLEKVYLGSNPISYLQPAYILKLCSPSANPYCTIYL